MDKLTVLSREQWLSIQHLSQDAAHAPYVNRLGILFEGKHDFWGTVPTSRYVFGHESRVIL